MLEIICDRRNQGRRVLWRHERACASIDDGVNTTRDARRDDRNRKRRSFHVSHTEALPIRWEDKNIHCGEKWCYVNLCAREMDPAVISENRLGLEVNRIRRFPTSDKQQV